MKGYILGRVQKANLQTKHDYEELCIYKYKEFEVNRFERKLNKFKSVIVVNNFSRGGKKKSQLLWEKHNTLYGGSSSLLRNTSLLMRRLT